MTSQAILQTVPLGTQWPTLDPFLFCAHHLDAYPPSDGELAPAADLSDRSLGADFSGRDGWNMYHGSTVPGFPQHPHRGFETVTYVRQGWCDHADSLGARARFGQGDVQWLTAGAGVVHSEMFPLFKTDEPNPLHLFQIWLNLPASSKMVDPSYLMLWNDELPRVVTSGGAEITVIAGALDGAMPPSPPPDSWASVAGSDIGIWHGQFDAGTSWELGAVGEETNRVLYLFEGDGVEVNGEPVASDSAAVLSSGSDLEVAARTGSAECLVLQGRPIGEPVAQYGPFVMNTRAEIEQTFADYQRTGFGGWPWDDQGPVHGHEAVRFAEHPGGRTERFDEADA